MKIQRVKKVSTGTLLFPFLLLYGSSCSLIDYHPYDARIDGETGINARNTERIEANLKGKSSLRFAVISDTQRWYDETRAAVRSINARSDIDFIVHCGDLSDFGATKEFEWMRRELQELKQPYVCLLGNHDCLGTGGDVFREMYGDPNFSFNAGYTHFVCLNTNAYEYDYSVSIPDFSYIKADQENLPDSIRQTVVVMHAQPYSEQFNNNVAEVFQEKIRLYPGLQFCLCGHGHHLEINDLFSDGILYYECSSIDKRKYIVFTINEEGYSHEVVGF